MNSSLPRNPSSSTSRASEFIAEIDINSEFFDVIQIDLDHYWNVVIVNRLIFTDIYFVDAANRDPLIFTGESSFNPLIESLNRG